MQYVIALCQKHTRAEDVLLILKDKPKWQQGRLNLPGGKVEEGETHSEAAAREVIEETGYTPLLSPREMGVLKDGDDEIFCMKVIVYGGDHPQPREEETQEVFWLPWYKADNDPRLIPNLRVIVPLITHDVQGWVIKDDYRSCHKNHHGIEILLPTRL